MLFVIEGLDRTGKTTLAKELATRLYEQDGGDKQLARLVHCEAPKGRSALPEYLKPLLTYRPGTKHLIFDRAHVGECVWPLMFNRRPKLTPSEYSLLHFAFHQLGGVYVFTERNVEELFQAFEEADPPEPLDSGLLPAAGGLFSNARIHLDRLGARVLSYDQSTAGDQWFEEAFELAGEAENKAFLREVEFSLPQALTVPGLVALAEAEE